MNTRHSSEAHESSGQMETISPVRAEQETEAAEVNSHGSLLSANSVPRGLSDAGTVPSHFYGKILSDPHE